MHMLRQDNQKLREAAISRLPRSPNVVSLLNNSFQIPFDVLALMRDYTADIQSDDTSSVASRARSESTNTGVDAIGAPAVSFGTSMEENISFCILDSTSIDLRIKYASICYRTISAYQPLVGCSFRDLPGPASNLPQVLRKAIN